ncbi:MAG TPA: hypothetical protein VMT70_08755 [Vicinamibacteria bacterium]|nr:hypothetical protein [Vicinamibacteria bacterium]
MTVRMAAHVRRLAPLASQIAAAAAPALVHLATAGTAACILVWAAGLLRDIGRGLVGRP